jgi:hypothetical protein
LIGIRKRYHEVGARLCGRTPEVFIPVNAEKSVVVRCKTHPFRQKSEVVLASGVTLKLVRNKPKTNKGHGPWFKVKDLYEQIYDMV